MAYTGEVHSSDYSDILDVVKHVLAGSDPGDKIYIEIHGDIAECDGSDDSYFVEAHRWNEDDEGKEDEVDECDGCPDREECFDDEDEADKVAYEAKFSFPDGEIGVFSLNAYDIEDAVRLCNLVVGDKNTVISVTPFNKNI